MVAIGPLQMRYVAHREWSTSAPSAYYPVSETVTERTVTAGERGTRAPGPARATGMGCSTASSPAYTPRIGAAGSSGGLRMGNRGTRSHDPDASDEGELPGRANLERPGSDDEPEELRGKGEAKAKARSERQATKAKGRSRTLGGGSSGPAPAG